MYNKEWAIAVTNNLFFKTLKNLFYVAPEYHRVGWMKTEIFFSIPTDSVFTLSTHLA